MSRGDKLGFEGKYKYSKAQSSLTALNDLILISRAPWRRRLPHQLYLPLPLSRHGWHAGASAGQPGLNLVFFPSASTGPPMTASRPSLPLSSFATRPPVRSVTLRPAVIVTGQATINKD